MFLTRIPCPSWAEYSEEHLNRSSCFAPIVGWIVGVLAALVLYCAALLFPLSVAVILSMAFTVWITGALHEDGFADFCDGFGGQRDARQTLEIMKDPRCGVYGVTGIALLLLLKFTLLYEMGSMIVRDGTHDVALFLGATLVAAHSLSRFASVSFIYTDEYARREGSSKSGSVASKMTDREFVFAAICGLLPLALFVALGWPIVLVAVLPMLLARYALGRMFLGRLGGYTGDCLGGVQQVTEVVFYLVVCSCVYLERVA